MHTRTHARTCACMDTGLHTCIVNNTKHVLGPKKKTLWWWVHAGMRCPPQAFSFFIWLRCMCVLECLCVCLYENYSNYFMLFCAYLLKNSVLERHSYRKPQVVAFMFHFLSIKPSRCCPSDRLFAITVHTSRQVFMIVAALAASLSSSCHELWVWVSLSKLQQQQRQLTLMGSSLTVTQSTWHDYYPLMSLACRFSPNG